MKDSSEDNKDSLMRTSYYILTRNFTKSVNRFIVFQNDGKNIEVHHGTGHRSKFINMMVEYFESIEEYEKCEKLLKLRELILMAGD